MVSFKVTKNERQTIGQIAKRGLEIQDEPINYLPQIQIAMDITAAHANGCPLKLAELLKANDFNFIHDVFGINRHLNRETGQLEDYFLPRFAE